MFLRRLNKKGDAGIENVAKWLLYIGILVVASVAVIKAIGKFA